MHIIVRYYLFKYIYKDDNLFFINLNVKAKLINEVISGPRKKSFRLNNIIYNCITNKTLIIARMIFLDFSCVQKYIEKHSIYQSIFLFNFFYLKLHKSNLLLQNIRDFIYCEKISKNIISKHFMQQIFIFLVIFF